MEFTFVLSFLNQSPKILKNPLEFSYLSSTDTPAESLKAVFLIEHPQSWEQEIYGIELRADGKTLFHGGCDRQIVSLDEKGCKLTLWGRSDAAAVLDNEAIPQEYHNVSMEEIFNQHIKPYGLENNLGATGTLPAYRVTKGMSEWEAFSRFCCWSVGRIPYVCKNKVSFFVSGRGRNVITPKTWAVKNFSHVICRDKVISQVWMRDKSGQYRTIVQNQQAQKLQIQRRRCLIPAPEWSYPVTDASQRLKKSMDGRVYQEIELADLANWDIGSEVVVTIPGFYHRGNIVQREIGFDQQRAYTRLKIE